MFIKLKWRQAFEPIIGHLKVADMQPNWPMVLGELKRVALADTYRVGINWK